MGDRIVVVLLRYGNVTEMLLQSTSDPSKVAELGILEQIFHLESAIMD